VNWEVHTTSRVHRQPAVEGGGHDIDIEIEHAHPHALVSYVLPDPRAHEVCAHDDPESQLRRRKHAQQQLDQRAPGIGYQLVARKIPLVLVATPSGAISASSRVTSRQVFPMVRVTANVTAPVASS
jgi:hypothetical protein